MDEVNQCEDSAQEEAANMTQTDECLSPLKLRHLIGFNGEVRGGLIVHLLGQHIIYTVGFNIVIEHVSGRTAGRQEVLSGHTGTICALALSNDGRFIASGQEVTKDAKAPIILWDWCSRQPIMKFGQHKTNIECLTFSCTTKHFMSLGGQDDGRVVVWSTGLKKPVVSQLAQIERAGIMHCLAASKIEDGIFATGGDTYGRLWTFDCNEKTLSFVEFKFGPYSRVIICMEIADFDNSQLPLVFCGTTSGDVITFHGRSGTLQFAVPGKPLPLGITAISYTRMLTENSFCFLLGTGEGKVGYYVITRNLGTDKRVTGTIKLWEGKKPWKDERENSPVTSISKIGDGHCFFVGTKDCKMYRFHLEKWSADLIRTCSNTPIMALAFPRGTDELIVTGEQNMVRVYNLRLLLEVRRYIRANRICKAVALNHDGTQIFAGWDDGVAIILGFSPRDLSLSELYRIHCTQKQAVTALALTSKSDVLVSGGDDGQCRVWRLVDDLDMRGKRLRQALLLFHLIEQSGPITAVKVSCSDEFCVSCSMDGTAVIYDLIKGLRKSIVKVHLGLTSVSFCNMDLQLLTCGGDGKIYYWEAMTGDCLRIVPGCPYGGIFCMDVDTESRMFATSGEDRLVKLWNLDEGTITHVGSAHSDKVLHILFGPSGTVLVSAAKDGAICLWNVPKMECA